MSFVFAAETELRSDTRTLVENSPFVPEGFVPPEQRQRPEPEEEPPPPPEDDPLDRLELRGITVLGDQSYFSFYHPDDQQSFWLGVDETEDGYTLLDYDPSADAVLVLRGERERQVTLKESRVQELSREEQRRQTEQRTRETSRETAAESEERLRQAAEELRRRRALRSN